MLSEQSSGLAPLFAFLAILLFAALAWCMISSCLGQSLAEFWNGLVLSARASRQSEPWRHRRDFVPDEFELEYRGRNRAA
ncbi:hypothetical protein PHLGIDRAFT_21417 [Phlebiopsis gigantea 11061_1 CR5-6]|uniref:Uncharacterized protein n=1 Tax=Phlebiopsis gigantea (strain 11061_1 CR5-6) TaxID=745531 RepID=A0A0C3SF88_PHLG1|nr:hypothetical protein PHLGIDRAFT_21417 [Phlebiopsis gigantea 11061_1 CR5-6]